METRSSVRWIDGQTNLLSVKPFIDHDPTHPYWFDIFGQLYAIQQLRTCQLISADVPCLSANRLLSISRDILLSTVTFHLSFFLAYTLWWQERLCLAICWPLFPDACTCLIPSHLAVWYSSPRKLSSESWCSGTYLHLPSSWHTRSHKRWSFVRSRSCTASRSENQDSPVRFAFPDPVWEHHQDRKSVRFHPHALTQKIASRVVSLLIGARGYVYQVYFWLCPTYRF